MTEEKRIGMAKAFAEEIEDPFLSALADAPMDDEPEALEEAQAVLEGEEAIARGDVISWEEAKGRLRSRDLMGTRCHHACRFSHS